MPARKHLVLLVLTILSSGPAARSAVPSDEKCIRSEEPAARWEDAMLAGNGLIGVMQLGDPLDEVFIFNSHEFLYPNGAPEPIPDMSDQLEPMRDRMLEGEIGEGWMEYLRVLLERRGVKADLNDRYAGMVWTQSFHPGYLLHLHLEPEGEVSDYERLTDYETGEITVRWTDARGAWQRRTFVSRADGVIVTSVSAPASGQGLTGSLNVEPAPRSPESVEYETIVTERYLNLRGKYPKVKGEQGGFEGGTRVVVSSGELRRVEDTLQVEGASELLLLTRLARYRSDHTRWEAEALQAGLDELEPSYESLLARHVAKYAPIFDRVEFSVGAAEDDHLATTEELLRREVSDPAGVDLALLEKLFYTSRYLFMASSGERYAPRLTGMFVGEWGAAWAGDYTCNANVNLAVMGGNTADLPECMEGYYRILERSLPHWYEGAEKLYGCRGLLGPVRIDGELAVPLHVSSYHAHSTTTGLGPWLLYPLWEHYQITGDERFLRERLYPLLKDQALFYEDFLTRFDEHGRLIFVPSNSPENGWEGIVPRTSASINSVFDIAACKHLLRMLAAAERELAVPEHERVSTWRAMLEKMPPYLIDEEGVFKEWAWASYGENQGHRHLSHMYVLWPAYEVNPDDPSTAPLIPAVRRAIHRRPRQINAAHGSLMKAIAWIRLKDHEEWFAILQYLLENEYLYRSLASSHDSEHHIYNYDFILSLQGLLIEMCLFTDDRVIELLPAVPPELPTGRLQGVKGRNRTTITDLGWNLPERTVRATIVSEVDQSLTLIHRRGIESLECSTEAVGDGPGADSRVIRFRAKTPVEITIEF